MSTVETGNKFRDSIRDLVRLAGWRPDTERLVGGKRADLLFYRMHFGRRLNLVVEAKNENEPLGLAKLEKIVGGYVAAQNANEIDELWIVAPHDLIGGKEFIKTLRWVQFFTQQSLLRVLMDFSAYLNTTIFEHERSGLESYFISPQARLEAAPDQRFSLTEFLGKWEVGGDRRPIAIVEGYGTGKTSIARHLTYKLAIRCLENGSGRIPIYVELGRLTSQQRLSGLFTALFATDHLITNFSYRLFRHMNAMGCFLVILDGFDEMKHLMTPSDFDFNFGELSQLVEGDARVILLGRPSAFSSGEERQYLLHGRRMLEGQIGRDTDKPDYVEVRLQPFSKEQVAIFVERFLRYKSDNVAPGAEPLSEETIQARLKEIKDNDYGDLLERPVQARMLAELATSHSRPLGELTRFTLYKRFMDELIRREMKKEARQQFSSDVRRRFSQQLSWWMWSTNHTLGVRLQEIPTEIFTPYGASTTPVEAIRRDLVSGSFLDAKEGDLFIVPHRSMIEFSVAENIIAEACGEGLTADFLKRSWHLLTTDVMAFVLEARSEQTLAALAEALRTYMGELSSAFLNQLASNSNFTNVVGRMNAAEWAPWHLQIMSRDLLATVTAGLIGTRALHEAQRLALRYLESRDNVCTRLASTILAVLPFSAFESMRDDTVSFLIQMVIRHADISRLKFTEGERNQPQVILSTIDPDGRVIDAFRKCIKADTSDGSLRIVINPVQLAGRMANSLHPRYTLADAPRTVGVSASGINWTSWPMPGVPERVVLSFNDLREEGSRENWNTLRRFLAVRPKVVIKERSVASTSPVKSGS